MGFFIIEFEEKIVKEERNRRVRVVLEVKLRKYVEGESMSILLVSLVDKFGKFFYNLFIFLKFIEGIGFNLLL